MVQRVRLLRNISRLWIIASCENSGLAWTGSSWAPIDRDGLSMSEVRIAHFGTPLEAAIYARSFGFDIERA
jgi:hypothetical protein